MKAVVAEHGEVVIPEAIRESMGIGVNTILDFVEEGDQLIARKVTADEVVRRVYGRLNLGKSTDEIMTDLRGKQ
jgi:AbrB family looped-hinge helix DNA binding protein